MVNTSLQLAEKMPDAVLKSWTTSVLCSLEQANGIKSDQTVLKEQTYRMELEEGMVIS